jgi:hypothetical protein
VNSRRDHDLRINPETAAQREMQEHAEAERERKHPGFIRRTNNTKGTSDEA